MKTEKAGVTRANEGIDSIVWNILGQTYVPKRADRAFLLLARDLPARHLRAAAHPPDQDEYLYVLEGGSTSVLDGKEAIATPGDLVRLPMKAARPLQQVGPADQVPVLGLADRQAVRPVLGHPQHVAADARRGGGAVGEARRELPAAAGVGAPRPSPSRGGSPERSDGGVGERSRCALRAAPGSPTPIPSPFRGGALGRLHLLLGEARHLRVAAHDRLALGVGQHVVDVGEAVRRAAPRPRRSRPRGRPCGSMRTISRGLRQPLRLVGGERCHRVLGQRERVGQAARVEDRLRRAVRADRIHRMRRIAEQRHAAVRPARQRIAVAHRILPELRRRRDQRLDVDIGIAKRCDVRRQLVAAGRAATSPPSPAGRRPRRRAPPPPSWSACGRAAEPAAIG